MPIPVSRQGNVDSQGGTPNCKVCGLPMDGAWWPPDIHPDHLLREWMEQDRIQSERSLRRARATRPELMARPRQDLFAASLESAFRVAELTNDADDHGTDDAFGGA